MEKPDRGDLLLAAPLKPAQSRIGLACLYGAVALLNIFLAWSDFRRGRDFVLPLSQALLWTILGIVFVRPKTVQFFQNGLGLPRNMDNHYSRARFVPWSQVQRYYWQGDVLYFVSAQSVLGAGDVSAISEPWAVELRSHEKVNTILARYVPGAAL